MSARRLLLALVLLGLAACRQPASDTPEHRPDTAAALPFPHGPYRYACADLRWFDARFPTRDSATVVLDRGDTLALPIAVSASGARYSDGTTVAWFRGMDEAFIQENDATTYADCRRTD